jgi:hypothetical protein
MAQQIDNHTLTADESKKITNGLKKQYPVTQDPHASVFLTTEGEWIQLNDVDEHWTVLPAITDKYVSIDKARNLSPKAYLSQGIIRAGFAGNDVFVNGEIPLNSKQIEALELTMIKKGLTSDRLTVEFSDEIYGSNLKRKLSNSFGEEDTNA